MTKHRLPDINFILSFLNLRMSVKGCLLHYRPVGLNQMFTEARF
jgi:hypothetical protein